MKKCCVITSGAVIFTTENNQIFVSRKWIKIILLNYHLMWICVLIRTKNRAGNPCEFENSDTDSASETEHDPQIIIGNENEHTLSKDGTEIESNSDITNIMRS